MLNQLNNVRNQAQKISTEKKIFDKEKMVGNRKKLSNRLTVSHSLTIATEPTPTQIFFERLPSAAEWSFTMGCSSRDDALNATISKMISLISIDQKVFSQKDLHYLPTNILEMDMFEFIFAFPMLY